MTLQKLNNGAENLKKIGKDHILSTTNYLTDPINLKTSKEISLKPQ